MFRSALPICFVAVTTAAFASAAAAQSKPSGKHSSDELAIWLDSRFYEIWKSAEAEAKEPVDDATYLRRVYLDLVGTIPSVAQTRDFLADENPDKRRKIVEELAADGRYASHQSRVWRRIMVPAGSPGAMFATQLEPWLEQQFAANIPYDEFARRLITAKGNGGSGTPLTFYAAIGNTPDNLASSFSRIFLGVRIGCAKCHNHPFADWRQEDFWGMAAFFASISRDGNPNGAVNDSKVTKIKPMESTKEYEVRFLWSEEPAKIPDNRVPREVLADWMVARENRNFSATAVNRVWQQLCGVGLIPQVDDLDQVSSKQRGEMLDELARRFADAEFDVNWLVQGICKSKAYQRVSMAEEIREQSPLSTHRPLKTLSPEQVFDALEQALMLPVGKDGQSPRHNGQREQIIARLNEAVGEAPDQYRAGIPQTLLMMQGTLISRATDLEESRTLRAVVDAPFLEPASKIETLYLAALTRKPESKELDTLLRFVTERGSKDERRKAYAEIYWALLNSPEFVLSR